MPGAAVLLRHRDAEQPELRHPAEHPLAIEAVLPVGFPDVRRDLAGAPLADRLFEQTLFVGQVEVDHGGRSGQHRYHAPRATCTARAACRRASVSAALPPLAAISR